MEFVKAHLIRVHLESPRHHERGVTEISQYEYYVVTVVTQRFNVVQGYFVTKSTFLLVLHRLLRVFFTLSNTGAISDSLDGVIGFRPDNNGKVLRDFVASTYALQRHEDGR